MNDKEWRTIDGLREVGESYSGLYYSNDYVQKHKNMKDMYAGRGDAYIGIAESIVLKRNSVGDIVYCVEGRSFKEDIKKEYKTQFGTFYSENNGEFGGFLITPNGEKIGGNYEYVFDMGDSVYAISTISHLGMGHTSIYEFTSNLSYKCIYSVGDLMAYFIENGIIENFACRAVDVNKEEALILLSGYVKELKKGGKYWGEFRVLKTERDNISQVCSGDGSLVNARSILADGNDILIGMDKMLIRIDLITKNTKYYTCLSDEDIEELLKVKAEREDI